MLNKLAALLWDEANQVWCARARGSNVYVKDVDPEQAIINAIEAKDGLQDLPKANSADPISSGAFQEHGREPKLL